MKYIVHVLAFFILAFGLAACTTSGSGDSISKAAAFQKTAAHSSFLVNGNYLRVGSCYHLKKETKFAAIRRIPGNTMFATGISRDNSFVYTMNNRTIMGTSPLLIVDFEPGKQGQTKVTVHSKKGIFSGAFSSPADAIKKELADCIGS